MSKNDVLKQEIMNALEAAGAVGAVRHIEFSGYIVPLTQRKKVDGEWKEVTTPYMSVDGRLAMANEDHRRQGKMFDILPPTVLVDDDKQLTLMAHINSEIYGQRTGIASSDKTSAQAEGQHPWEIAETSAIGRALAAFGYGLLPGTGLTSADDMSRVLNRGPEGSKRTDERTTEYRPTRPNPGTKEFSDAVEEALASVPRKGDNGQPRPVILNGNFKAADAIQWTGLMQSLVMENLAENTEKPEQERIAKVLKSAGMNQLARESDVPRAVELIRGALAAKA